MSGADCVRWMLNIISIIFYLPSAAVREDESDPVIMKPSENWAITLAWTNQRNILPEHWKNILHDEIDEHTQDEYCQSSSSMSLTIISIQGLNTRVKRSVRLRHLSLVRNLHHLNNVEQCQLMKFISTIQCHVFESAVNENVNIWGGSDLNISWRTTISINR